MHLLENKHIHYCSVREKGLNSFQSSEEELESSSFCLGEGGSREESNSYKHIFLAI